MKASSLFFLAIADLVAVSLGETHDLIVGTFSHGRLFTVRFDDEALTLDEIGATSVPYANSWISLSASHDKKTLYGTAFNANPPGFISYTLKSSTTIQRNAIVHAGGDCNGSAIYVASDPRPPHAVYGTFFWREAGCGAVTSVDPATGVLNGRVVQNFTYERESGVHGVAFSPDSRFLYSADTSANALWTHAISRTDGSVKLVSRLAAVPDTAHPRHIVAHPGGRFLYAVHEGSSEVAQYTVNPTTGVPRFEGVSYPLIRDGQDPVNFWADEVALSASSSYLWATNRARDVVNGKGYISAFELDKDGDIVRQNFLIETENSGGWANSVTPSPFSDRFVALTDNSTGLLQIWSLDTDRNGARIAANISLLEGCCANAVWYS